MQITVACPRCKQSIAVADKMAGSYAACPYCNGRFWIPENADDDPPQPGPAPLATPPAGAAPAPSPAAPPAKPTAPAPTKKVARFVTAEAAQSTLNLAENGKLPELHLEEAAKAKSQQDGVTVNPLVLLGLVCLSVVSSVLLVFYTPEQETSSHSSRQAEARRIIEMEYFADLDSPAPRQPYQILLREAQRAYARGDRETERRLLHRGARSIEGRAERLRGHDRQPHTRRDTHPADQHPLERRLMQPAERYEIVNTIASGDFATVYRAETASWDARSPSSRSTNSSSPTRGSWSDSGARPNCWLPFSIPTSSRSTTSSGPAGG